MSKCYLLGGKNGDIIGVLPILYDEWKRTGIKPTLMVSKEYSGVLHGVDYVTPHIFDGDWQDLNKSIKLAKRQFDSVIPLQTYGRNFPIQKRHSSFQLDAWDRAGCLDKWDTLPLAVESKTAQMFWKEFTILFADHSQSSPFLEKEELYRLLRESFESANIIRLSEIKTKNFCDFISFYNGADILVSVETAHLHLSAASKIPTFALVTDKPSHWHGSTFSKRFKFHCRYSKFQERKHELISKLKSVLAGEQEPHSYTLDIPFSGYNPSIFNLGDRQLIAYRVHDRNDWRTSLYMREGDKDTKIQFQSSLDSYSLEDARLFLFRGNLHCSFTISMAEDGLFKCVTAYGELTEENGAWHVKKYFVPKYGKNDFSSLEKNFVMWESDSKLLCLYRCEPEQIILELDGEKVVKEHKSKPLRWGYGEIRGGTSPIEHDGKWLRFFHSRIGKEHERYDFRYFSGAMLMSPTPPYPMLALSREPILWGDEGYNLDGCKHHKGNVAIIYGAVKQGNDYLASYGYNDSRCRIIKLSAKDLKL